MGASVKIPLLIINVSLISTAVAVSCYQCANSVDPYCNQKLCHHGLFGCIKTVTYAGGLDPSGSQREDPYHKVLYFKGCNMLPFGGIEGCREIPLIGDIRQVTCYCNYDFCNSATLINSKKSWMYIIFIITIAWMFQ